MRTPVTFEMQSVDKALSPCLFDQLLFGMGIVVLCPFTVAFLRLGLG